MRKHRGVSYLFLGVLALVFGSIRIASRPETELSFHLPPEVELRLQSNVFGILLTHRLGTLVYFSSPKFPEGVEGPSPIQWQREGVPGLQMLWMISPTAIGWMDRLLHARFPIHTWYAPETLDAHDQEGWSATVRLAKEHGVIVTGETKFEGFGFSPAYRVDRLAEQHFRVTTPTGYIDLGGNSEDSRESVPWGEKATIEFHPNGTYERKL